VLVVANRTADSEEVLAALLERAQQSAIEVTMLTPATWEVVDPHGGVQSARRRLRAALTGLRDAGVPATGVVGDADPCLAVEAIWDPERFDEVVVATLPQHVSRWLRLDLPGRLERLTGRCVRDIIASERPRLCAASRTGTWSAISAASRPHPPIPALVGAACPPQPTQHTTVAVGGQTWRTSTRSSAKTPRPARRTGTRAA